ncbi:MAG: FAD-dependent oxidoreductase [Chloroflexi bacterium]|nr:FAD-dependent oxidoreductase [Chloroflexota bacterium]
MLRARGVTWDNSADVVVVGYGLAGAAAAITAHDLGARVVLVEKQPADARCTCSSLSGGLFLCPKDVDGAIEYLKSLYWREEGAQWTDLDTITAWARYTAQNVEWLKGLGGEVRLFSDPGAEFPELPGASSIAVWVYQGRGLRMMEFMDQQVASRNIEVLYEAPAQRLIVNENDDVVGVRASRGGEEVNIKANKAVILCSGGFEGNEGMKLQYLRIHPVYYGGGIDNTGDGIRMAQEVGADLWHMNCCSARLKAKFPDFPYAFSLDFSGADWAHQQIRGVKEKVRAGYIVVDRYGRRFTSENMKTHAVFYEVTFFDTHKLECPRVPSHYVFDQRRIESGAIAQRSSGPAGPHQLYKWSADNQVELKKGWIVAGNTVAELAGKLGMVPAVLAETVERWNGYCADGRDPEFSRNPLELAPLDSPPYYAVRLYPGMANTQGGPRRNSRAQVVNPFGEPIPGLFAAGEGGSIYGMLYPVGGGNLAECIAFGRIAAENAVK